MKLYHGTSAAKIPAILRDGLKPRGRRTGNWKHSIESNPGYVYLTNAYAIYFAGNTAKDKEPLAVIEIDSTKLNPFCLAPDEDFLEQVTRKKGPAPLDKDYKFRTRWYRKRLSEFSQYWEKSLEGLGTCCHFDDIGPEAITRVATLPYETYLDLIMHGMDPSITVMNYAICGAKYRNYIHWLFDDALEPDPMRREDDPSFPDDIREMIGRGNQMPERSGIVVRAANALQGACIGAIALRRPVPRLCVSNRRV